MITSKYFPLKILRKDGGLGKVLHVIKMERNLNIAVRHLPLDSENMNPVKELTQFVN